MIHKPLTTLAAVLSALGVTSAQAAKNELKEVCGWGPNPTDLQLHVYTPPQLAAKPAVLLVLHWCGGTGPEIAGAKYNSLADEKGFVALYPTTTKDSNCWDVDSTKSLTHDGGGDTTSLANIVKWALHKYSADPSRVFLTGISSGCLMSNVMAATYPDLFAAASCYAGAPAGCLAGSGGSSANSTDGVCTNGLNIKTPTEWADVAHAMYPGYTGSYPRFQTWHGDADEVVSYNNFGEELKQWSALHGVSHTANITDTPVVGTTRIEFGDGTKVVGYSVKDGSHVLPMQEVVDLEWFGL